VQDNKILSVQILLLCVTFCKLSLLFHIFWPHHLFAFPSQLTVSSLHPLVLLYLSTQQVRFVELVLMNYIFLFYLFLLLWLLLLHKSDGLSGNIQIVMW